MSPGSSDTVGNLFLYMLQCPTSNIVSSAPHSHWYLQCIHQNPTGFTCALRVRVPMAHSCPDSHTLPCRCCFKFTEPVNSASISVYPIPGPLALAGLLLSHLCPFLRFEKQHAFPTRHPTMCSKCPFELLLVLQ